jgi:plastocyanin
MTASTVNGSHRLAAPALLLALALAGLGLAACEGAEEGEPEEVGTELGTAGGAEPAGDEYFEGDTGTETPVLGAATVEVRLHGRTIEMPATLPPGETTFVVTNTGEHEHNFEIEGQGIEEELESNLQPGESGELTVDLRPGTYTVYCPVGDHREEGMVTTLRVAG